MKKRGAEVVNVALNLVYEEYGVNSFFLNASKLYKEANLIDREKFDSIGKAIKSDQCKLQFVFLR